MIDDNKSGWLDTQTHQAILQTVQLVALEYNCRTGAQRVSPTICDYFTGDYSSTPLTEVFLAEHIVYPDDLAAARNFMKELTLPKNKCEAFLRLYIRTGEYLWFQITMLRVGDSDLWHGILANIDTPLRQRQELHYQVHYDAISGLLNKDTFFLQAKKLLDDHAAQEFHLLRMDIDRFKLINQLYSVTEGDRVLKYIGDILRDLLTATELASRLGSDIFAIILQRSQTQTIAFISELEKRVNRYEISFHFILSVGVLHISSYHDEPINILCDRAALAQSTIKGNYIRRYAFYEKYMSDALNHEHYIIARMGKALAEQQFVIYLQPKWNMLTQKIIGAEALVRWIHPQDGLIPPNEFIPLFERNGFIQDLDEYVWDCTCSTLRDWLDRGLPSVPISVNVSRVHIYDPAFPEKIIALTKKYQLSPDMLELEITESAYTECPQTLYNIMDELQNAGFHFSMDDFGSGYSSLSVLKDIPVDIVKIDMNFLQSARRGAQVGRNILQSAIRLVQNLDLPVIVEGVETQEQISFLLQNGCVYAQGYFYARPMPVADFEDLLCQN